MGVLAAVTDKQRKNLWIVATAILLFSLAALRLSLVGQGAGELWDEGRYFFAYQAVCNIGQLEFASAAQNLINGTLGRPGVILLWLPPILGQLLGEVSTGLSHETPASLMIPQIWNVVIWAVQWLLFLVLCCRLLANRWQGLVAATLFGLCGSSIFYVRHLYPMDAALLFLFASLVVVSGSLSMRQRAVGGALLTACCFFTYPGYYWAPLLVLTVAFFKLEKEGRQAFYTIFGVVGAISILIVEGTGKLWGATYGAALNGLAKTIKAGSFAESWRFPFIYLRDGEGLLGMALGGLLVLFLALLLKKVFKREGLTALEALSLVAILGIVFHSFAGYFLHWMVWYGRIYHLFLPFLVLLAVQAVTMGVEFKWSASSRQPPRQPGASLRTLVLTGVVLLGLLGLGLVGAQQTWRTLSNVSYPRDLLFQTGLTAMKINPERRLACGGCYPSAPQWRYEMLGVEEDRNYHPELLLVNFCSGFIAPVAETAQCQALEAGVARGRQVLFSKPHYYNAPWYLFEGYTPEDRQELLASQPHLIVAAVK